MDDIQQAIKLLAGAGAVVGVLLIVAARVMAWLKLKVRVPTVASNAAAAVESAPGLGIISFLISQAVVPFLGEKLNQEIGFWDGFELSLLVGALIWFMAALNKLHNRAGQAVDITLHKNAETQDIISSNNLALQLTLTNEILRFQAILERSQLLSDLQPITEAVLDELNAHQPDISAALNKPKGARDQDLILRIFKSKFKELCSQVGDSTYYMRYARFRNLWPDFTKNVDYLSTCDLSQYSSDAFGYDEGSDYFKDLLGDWQSRLEDELNDLNTHNMTIKKLIIFTPPVGKRDSGILPPCRTGSGCDPGACEERTCIVNPVATKWQVWGKTKGIKSIWVVSKSEVEDEFRTLLRSSHHDAYKEAKLGAIDLGLFGDDLIGEEFKWRPYSLRENKHPMDKFLYRFRLKPDLVKDVRGRFETITTKAKPLVI